MRMQLKFDVMKTFLQKLMNALNGIALLVRTEKHFRYHLFATFLVISIGVILSIATWEWLFVASALFSVLTAEGFNTAMEKVCDEITTERKQSIQIIKDIAAGTVLISVIYSIVVGLIIFLPKMIELFLEF